MTYSSEFEIRCSRWLHLPHNMQNKNAYVRIKKWVAKFSGERQGVGALLSKEKAKMEISKIFAQQWKDEAETKMILAEAASPRHQNPFYINFSREVRGLRNQGYNGGQLIAQVDIVLNKYVGYGLDRDILERIRNTCYALAAPAP